MPNCRRDRTGGPAGCAIAGRATGRLPASTPTTGRCAGHTRCGPQLGDSAGRRSATNREQRCVALGAVALPAGTTVGQGHVPRVGDGDLLAADASALWLGFRCLWLCCARFNHGPGSIFPADWLSRGRCQSTRADLRSEHPPARLVGGLGLVRSSGSCRETVTSVGRPSACDQSQGSRRSPRSPVGSWTTGGSRRLVSRGVRLRECCRCRAACRGRDSRAG